MKYLKIVVVIAAINYVAQLLAKRVISAVNNNTQRKAEVKNG